MAIIQEIKCARCDRKYSGIRSRCPYCGARRISKGKYSEGGDGNKGKMLISILILAVITAAVGAMLLTTPMPEEISPLIPGPSEEQSGLMPDDTAIDSIPGPGIPEPPEPIEEDEPPPEPNPQQVESVVIRYDSTPKSDVTARVGEQVPLNIVIEPAGIEFEGEIEWISERPDYFDVVIAPNTENLRATVTGIGVGTAKLIVKVGDIEAECIFRIKAR